MSKLNPRCRSMFVFCLTAFYLQPEEGAFSEETGSAPFSIGIKTFIAFVENI